MPGTGVEAGASYGDLLVTSLLVLGAVCIAALIAVRFFGRFLSAGRAKGSHLLDVVARVSLEPRRSLYVVEVAGKTLLVGTSEMGLSVLSELDGQEVKSRAVPSQSFADLVRSAWGKRKGLAQAAREDVSAEPSRHASSDVSAEARQDAGASRSLAGSGVSAETRDGAGPDVSAKTRQDGRASRSHAGSDVSAEAHKVDTTDVRE